MGTQILVGTPRKALKKWKGYQTRILDPFPSVRKARLP